MRAASWVGRSSVCARVRMRKSAVLSLSVTVRAGELLVLEPRGHALGQPPEPQLQRAERRQVRVECGLSRYALGFAVGAHEPLIAAVRKVEEPHAFGAVATHQLMLADPLQIADGRYAVLVEARLRRLADPENLRDRARRQERRRLFARREP